MAKSSPKTKLKDKPEDSFDSTKLIQPNDRRAVIFARKLLAHIKKHKGQFVRDEDGSLHVIFGVRRIPLTYDRDNHGLAELMIESCRVTTLMAAAQSTIQRVQVEAAKQSNRLRLKRFSALSDDGERLYIPVCGGRLVRVTGQKIELAENGQNEDSFWVEHPYDAPLKYSDRNPKTGLEQFERLLVETQACKSAAMRWLVAMHEGFFPFIRDVFPARFLLIHIGPTQQGKTTGAQRFTLLHGLGLVKGDYSVAALGNMKDIGLLVLDNKEQANLTVSLIDFLLFLSTGAERGRSLVDGRPRTNRSRPVGVLTTIEGVWKAELRARCIEIPYSVAGSKIGRALIESDIKKYRHEIGSAMVLVLQRYLQIKHEKKETPNPRPDFEEHFTGLSDLLRAYGEVSGKPEDWSESLIQAWNKALLEEEIEESELEHPIDRILKELTVLDNQGVKKDRVYYLGKAGTLYVTEASTLLTLLEKLNLYGLRLPKNPSGLSRRLNSSSFRSFVVLDEQSAPEMEQLRRTSSRRPIGFFIEDDADDGK